jgi:hypothetical protein
MLGFGAESEINTVIGRPNYRWEDNTKMGLRESIGGWGRD